MVFKCKECKKESEAYHSDDRFGTGLCYRCFESAMEDFEDDRHRKIAERNEY